MKDINLHISGGMFGLLGKNGAGKTTFMKIMTTLITVCGSGGNLSAFENEIIGVVLLFSMILGSVYTLCKLKIGVVMGTFVAAGIYMIAVMGIF